MLALAFGREDGEGKSVPSASAPVSTSIAVGGVGVLVRADLSLFLSLFPPPVGEDSALDGGTVFASDSGGLTDGDVRSVDADISALTPVPWLDTLEKLEVPKPPLCSALDPRAPSIIPAAFFSNHPSPPPAAEYEEAEEEEGKSTRPAAATLGEISRSRAGFGRAGDGLFASKSMRSAASLSAARCSSGVSRWAVEAPTGAVREDDASGVRERRVSFDVSEPACV